MRVDASPFYVTGGTLRPDAPSYVERQADQDLYESLEQSEFCYVLTARQMGKSSLMIRTAARLRQAGVRVAVLDLTTVGHNVSAEQWYRGLLNLIGEQLDLEAEVERFWRSHEHLGPLHRFMAALREAVLPRVQGSGFRVQGGDCESGDHSPLTTHHSPELVIFIDEIDAVRS